MIKRSLPGDTILTFSLPVTPEPVTEEERIRYARTYSQRYAISPSDVFETKPVLERIVGDGEGHIFAFPRTMEAGAGTVVDVFRDSGVYLGRVQLPVRLLLLNLSPFVRGSHLYGVMLDDFDVEHVVRLRLEGRNE